MSKVRYLIVSLVVALLIIASIEKKEAAEANTSKAADVGAQKDIDTVQHKVLAFDLEGMTDKGEKKWQVTGESAESITGNKVKLNNIVAKAYGAESEAVITADKGIYDKTKNNVTLEKNVKATIENAESGAGSYTGFTNPLANPSDTKKTTVEKKEKRKIIITCDGEVEFDYEKNQAYFSNNVKVISEDGNIDADKITLNLDTSTKKIKDIVAEGNVKITKDGNTTYSDKATYIETEKKIILTGKPKLVIYQEGGLGENVLGK